MTSKSLITQYLAVVLAFGMLAAPMLQARVEPSHGMNFFSPEQDVQAGKEGAAEVNKQLPILPDSNPITIYVQRLGAQLAAHAPGEKWPYNFHVVNQKEINAFALPGGPVYVNLGTIQAADNEAELAGVIAHEISHVVQRHGTRAASKQMFAQVPLAILGGLAGRGALTQMAALGLSFGAQSILMKNSRTSEKEADLLGADIMYDTGYDPHAMAQFFTKIQEQGGARSVQFLSDHPDPGNRVQYVSAEVRTLPGKSHYLAESSEFRQVKQEVSGMRPLTAQQIAQQQRQVASAGGGISPGEVSPSERMQSLSHRDFQISYPENWQTFGDQSSSVTIAPRSGVTQDAVAYGLMVNSFQPEDPAASLDQSTHELLASLRQANPDLREIGNDENIRVDGSSAKSVDLMGNSPVQENGRPARERDWLITTKRHDGSLLYLIFIAPDKDFNSLRPTFEDMLKSLRVK